MKVKDLEFKIIGAETESCGLARAALPTGEVFTVLTRETGFSDGCGGRVIDTETGYRNSDGKFWLAMGNVDIRREPDLDIYAAIDLIKALANVCSGD